MTGAVYVEWMSKRSQFSGREGNQGSLHLKADLPFVTPDELSVQPAGSPPSKRFLKPFRNNGEKKPAAANEHRILAERNPTEISVTSTLIAKELVVIDAIPENTKGINND